MCPEPAITFFELAIAFLAGYTVAQILNRNPNNRLLDLLYPKDESPPTEKPPEDRKDTQ